MLLLGLQTYSRVTASLLQGLNSPVNPAWGRTSNLTLPVMLKTRKPLSIIIDESLTQLFISCSRLLKLGAVLARGSCGFSGIRDGVFLGMGSGGGCFLLADGFSAVCSPGGA